MPFASTAATAGDFYSTAATVLPVLFVVLSVEFAGAGYLPDTLTEVERPSNEREHDMLDPDAQQRLRHELMIESWYTPIMMAIFCAGEIVALIAIEAGLDTLATRLVTWSALGCGAAACVFPIIALQIRVTIDAHKEMRIDETGVTRRPWLVRTEGVVSSVAAITAITIAGVLVFSEI
jgi:hypothetical protein